MIGKGDILLLSFPFTNLQSAKVRPALVVSCDSFNKTSSEAIFIFITSIEYKGQFDLRLNTTDAGFQSTGLKVSSTFRIAKLMCLEQKLVRRRLGRAEKHFLESIDKALMSLFDLSRRANK